MLMKTLLTKTFPFFILTSASSIVEINCRYTAATEDAVNYYTCTELSNFYGITVQKFFELNPSVNTACSNIKPNTEYCVSGRIAKPISTDGFCGPSYGDTTCLGTEKQCCNSATWKCGETFEDCRAGACYEGACEGFPSDFSLDGKCGAKNGEKLCGKWGNCCNTAGVCGNGTEFCETGKCQSGQCELPPMPTDHPWERGTTPDGTCGGTNGYTCGIVVGSCCNKDGFCGSRATDCGIGCTTSSTAAPTPTPSSISPDGSCGGKMGYKCKGSSFGDCCSASGYCGSTNAHCTAGCQSAFGTCTTVDVSPDGTCGGINKYKCQNSSFGNCCSASGYCGSTSAHCTAGCQAAFGTCTTTDISPDGTCGGTNKYKCKGSSFGDCCSASGYCGSTSAHCTAGCQSAFGTCTTTDISPDGTCGGTNKYKCKGSSFGNCCSSHGYCGTTVDHCGTGCQSLFGTCF